MESPALRPALVGPGGFYVTGEDNWRIQSFNAATGVVVTIRGRMLTLAGVVVPFELTHTPNTDRTLKTTLHAAGEGWLLNAYAIVSSGAPILGQTFVELQLVRGLEGAVLELATVLQGVVSAAQRLAWPGSPLATTIASPGNVRLVTGTDPAAGAEISEAVPTGARWRILSLFATLVSSADAANRIVALLIDDGATTYYRSESGETQVANQTRHYVWANAQARHSAFNLQMALTAPGRMVLRAGHRIFTSTQSLQAADNWGPPQLLIEEWIEGA